jgi:hypothetical protein
MHIFPFSIIFIHPSDPQVKFRSFVINYIRSGLTPNKYQILHSFLCGSCFSKSVLLIDFPPQNPNPTNYGPVFRQLLFAYMNREKTLIINSQELQKRRGLNKMNTFNHLLVFVFIRKARHIIVYKNKTSKFYSHYTVFLSNTRTVLA